MTAHVYKVTPSTALPNDTDRAVDCYLPEHYINVNITFTHMDENDPNWIHDAWTVVIRTPRGTMRTNFKTGLGHRVKASQHAPNAREFYYTRGGKHVWWWGVPVKPTAASVLYALLLDAESACQSFDDWCADFGYDTDSRRAMNTYIECGVLAKQVRAVFAPEQLEHLRELLADY